MTARPSVAGDRRDAADARASGLESGGTTDHTTGTDAPASRTAHAAPFPSTLADPGPADANVAVLTQGLGRSFGAVEAVCDVDPFLRGRGNIRLMGRLVAGVSIVGATATYRRIDH